MSLLLFAEDFPETTNGVWSATQTKEFCKTWLLLISNALCLHPYFRDSHSGSLGLAVFPPTGLEYVASAMKPYVEKLTLVDLRLPGPLRDIEKLTRFIEDQVDLLCISVNWEYQFEETCRLVNSLPQGVTTIVGGKTGHGQCGRNVRALRRDGHTRARGRVKKASSKSRPANRWKAYWAYRTAMVQG